MIKLNLNLSQNMGIQINFRANFKHTKLGCQCFWRGTNLANWNFTRHWRGVEQSEPGLSRTKSL